MNLKELLSKFGTTVYTGMPPAKFVKAVVSVPVFVPLFPNLSVIATSVETLINAYDDLNKKVTDTEAAIASMSDNIDKAQSTLNKANEAYSKTLNTVGAYTAPTTGGPCVPNPTNTAVQESISVAVEALEKLKEELAGTKNLLALMRAELAKFYDKMMAQVSKYVDSIINTKVA